MELRQRILKTLKEKGILATYQLRILADAGYSKTFNEELDKLVKEGKVEKIVVNKGTYWELIE